MDQEDEKFDFSPAPLSPSDIFTSFYDSSTLTPPVFHASPLIANELTPTKRQTLHSQVVRSRKKRCSVRPGLEVIKEPDRDNTPPCIGEGESGVPSMSSLGGVIHDGDINFSLYVDAALADAAGFCQITADFFVAQGWDSRSAKATVNNFFLFN